MDLKFQVKIKIQKPVDTVFDAVYSPEKLSAYFTNGGASAPLDQDTTVMWRFADTPGTEPAAVDVSVIEMFPNERIALEWNGAGDHFTRVEMTFEDVGDSETLVKISETGWRETQADLDRSYGNCFGWSFMICALKAYVEHGVDLRKGSFSGMY
ncbi:MAG: SRPBCC domain-containing protein [Acidobacteriota bacterium]